MHSEMRVGIVGVGIMGQRHSEALQNNPATTVSAVADLDADHVSKVGEKFGATAYTSVDAMLSREQLDIVVISTPDPYHREPLMTVLDAGIKRVLIEKPFATTIDDATAMVEKIEAANASVFILFGTRAQPANAASRTIIEAGLIGDPTYASARVADNISVPRSMWKDRPDNWALKSSSVHFLYSHRIDRLRWFYQPAEVVDITAVSGNRVLGGSSDFVESFLTWDNGMITRVHTGWVDFGGNLVHSESMMQGTRGMITHNELPAFGRPLPGWQVMFDDIDDSALADAQTLLLERGMDTRLIVERRNKESLPETVKGLELLESDMPRQMIDYLVDGFIEETDCPESWRSYQGNATLPTARDGFEQTRICCAVELAASPQTGATV